MDLRCGSTIAISVIFARTLVSIGQARHSLLLPPQQESRMAKSARKKPLRQQPAFKKLNELLKQPGPHDLLWHHRAGECVERLFPIESGRQFGRELMPRIAEALGKTKSFADELWNYRSFFSAYEREEVVRLRDRNDKNKFQLSWTHVICLLTVEDVRIRSKLQIACLKQEWSTDELRRQVNEAQGRKSSGGRRLVRPKSLDTCLAQVIKESETWIKRHRQVWFYPEDPAIEIESKQGNPEHVAKQLDEVIESWQKMEWLIKEYLPRLRQMRAWFEKEAAQEAKRKTAKRGKPKKKASRKR